MPVFAEPVLFGHPLHLLVLYFVLYSFLGWVQETLYCSIKERHFVSRGFLYGPVCPIYGVGVLMMVCWFQPLTGNLPVFYMVSTVCMSAWEYFVGWFLETTTHVKYWDYSDTRFNLKGRICLWVSLTWGVLSYIVIYWVHPTVSGLVLLAPMKVRAPVAWALLALMLADTVATIRDLALSAKVMSKLTEAREEFQVQMALGRAELGERLEGLGERLEDRLEGLSGKLNLPAPNGEALEHMKARYDQLLNEAEKRTRRLRSVYGDMRGQNERYAASLAAVNEAGRKFLARRREERRERRAEKRGRKQ